MRKIKLTTWIMAGMVLGVAVGALCHALAASPAAAKDIAGSFSLLTDIFLRLIKMIIAPLVFATLVSGIASMSDGAALGRVGFKAFGWFVSASFISLFLGLLFSNVFQPGQMLGLTLPDAGAATRLATGSFSLKDFITQLVPKSFAERKALRKPWPTTRSCKSSCFPCSSAGPPHRRDGPVPSPSPNCAMNWCTSCSP
jgi:Na+/H+-dicarboxylate symporter